LQIAVPKNPLKVEKLFDGVEFDATKAVDYGELQGAGVMLNKRGVT